MRILVLCILPDIGHVTALKQLALQLKRKHEINIVTVDANKDLFSEFEHVIYLKQNRAKMDKVNSCCRIDCCTIMNVINNYHIFYMEPGLLKSSKTI